MNTTDLSWVFTQISRGGFLWNQTNSWHSPRDYFLQHIIYRLLEDRIFWICSQNIILRCYHLSCSEQNIPLTVSKTNFKKDEAQIQKNKQKNIPGNCIKEKSVKEVFEKSMYIFSTSEQKTNKQKKPSHADYTYIQPRDTAQGLSPGVHTCVSDPVQ